MSNKKSNWSREATTKLIGIYEKFPCLYMVSTPEYHNKNVRTLALEQIASELSTQCNEVFTMEEISKKIHGIRTQYLSEMTKIKKSKTSGTSTDAVYAPKLWCFSQLEFLRNAAPTRSAVSNLTACLETESVSESEECDYTLDEYLCTSPQEITETPTCSRPTSSASNISMERSAKRKRTTNADVGVEALLSKATNALSATAEDIHSTFGMMIAGELREIQNDDILEELKKDIIINVYNAKKKDRDARTTNTF